MLFRYKRNLKVARFDTGFKEMRNMEKDDAGFFDPQVSYGLARKRDSLILDFFMFTEFMVEHRNPYKCLVIS